MINRRVLEDLLQEPLGPYYDRDILHETACQMHGHVKPVLYSFVLEHDGHVTGLDESERPLEGKDNRRFRFRGTLKIADPRWLSDFGLKTVESELNLRAGERALREGERMTPPLTLEGLFERGLLKRSDDATWRKEDETKLMVLIQGEKSLPAVYMHSNRVRDGLLWRSEVHKREYQVVTMDVETYSRSETFFWRWRLLALMDKICKKFPYVPEKKRTPRWFVEKYTANFACPTANKQRRLIFDEEDSDVNEMGQTKTPRHLLRPHMSEILGLFAAHAEWFITNNEVRRKKLFDISSWEKFAVEARKQSREAARHGVRWGVPEGQEAESSDEEASDDGLDRLVRENPVIGKSNKTMIRKIQLARARSDRGKEQRLSSDPGSDEDTPGGARYISDFSQSSDGEENDSDHQLAEEAAVNQIPWQLKQPPPLPDVDGQWWCPLPGCGHRINLYELTEEEERGIPRELSRYILQKQWRNADDMKVLQGCKLMVTNHYLKHFEEQGVKVEQRDGKTRFVFMDGRQRNHDGREYVRGPMPARGTLGGESRIVPTLHA